MTSEKDKHTLSTVLMAVKQVTGVLSHSKCCSAVQRAAGLSHACRDHFAYLVKLCQHMHCHLLVL